MPSARREYIEGCRCEIERKRKVFACLLCMVLCVCVCVCREVEVMQLMCYFAVRHVNWTKPCDLASKLSFLTEGNTIISLLYSLFFKYNISYLVIFIFFFPKKPGQSRSHL